MLLVFENIIYEKFVTNWSARINGNVGISGRGRNKLRSYKTFKQNYIVENYCKIILPIRHRAAFSKFRCGVAPIRIETGRYEGLPEEARLCPFCNILENEMHVVMNCRVYDDLREPLLYKAANCNPTFNSLSEVNQFVQSTLVITNSKGLYETLRDIRTSTYQICSNEENN